MAILFFGRKDPHFSFSNFARHPVDIYGRTWATSEHAFQAMKFQHRPDLVQRVYEADSPGKAAEIGRDRSLPLRPDWDKHPGDLIDQIPGGPFPAFWPDDGIIRPKPCEAMLARVKDLVMYEVCLAKFTQHEALRQELLGTGTEILIEDTTSSGDAYWGWGRDHLGENKLGRILMAIRSRI